MKTNHIFSLFLGIAVLCSMSFRLNGQIVNIESRRIQSDSIRFVFHGDLRYKLQSNNNAKFNSLAGGVTTQFKSKSLKDIFLIIGASDFSKLDNSDITSSSLLHIRYNRKLSELIRLELFTQTQFNKVLDIRLRQLNGIGPRFKFVGKDIFKSYIGTLYMLENQLFYGPNETMQTRHRLSAYLTMLLSFAKHTGELSSVSYYQPRIDQFSDFRLSNQTSLSLKISSKLSMVNSLNLYYESKPSLNIANFNYLLENGLRLNL